MTVCSRCGKENQDHYKFCLGCGSDLTHAPGAAAAGTRDDGDGSGPNPAIAPAPLGAPHLDRRGPAPLGAPPAAGAGGFLGYGDATPGYAPTVAAGNSARGVGPAVAVAAQPASLVQPPAAVPMRTCPSCGKPVPYEFVFCGSCGTRLGAVAPPAVGAGLPRTLFMSQGGAAQAAPQPRGKLVLIRPDGGEGGSMPLLDGETLIGRNEGPLFESDSYLSPKHAFFVFRGAQLIVRDAGSLNGVFVKMAGEEEIADGEVFRLGQELLRFDVIRPPQPMEDGTEVMGSPNPGYWGRLSVILGRGQDGSAFPLFGESMIVGRERGDILFPEDGYVSGTHARVSRRDGRFYLSDLNSSNGSFLRIRGERLLRSGAFLLLGQQLFRVQYT